MLYVASVVAGKVDRKVSRLKPKTKLEIEEYLQPVYNALQGNNYIHDALLKGKPFVAARYGGVELQLTSEHFDWLSYQGMGIKNKVMANLMRDRRKHFQDKSSAAFCNNAGFFPNQEKFLSKYAELLATDSALIDMLGVWRNVYEIVMIRNYCSSSLTLSHPGCLEPYYHQRPWSDALAGKKVLVIHPYEQSIRKQYAQREKLFPETDILPAFELKTIKAVQSIAGAPTPFTTWFDALAHMKVQMEATDFDVLIVGAGAYGFHLAAHAKRLGKQAIHMGGATQILFGIKGARWDQHPVISKLYNEHWTRPLPSERPEHFNKVEGGCYW